MHEETRDPLRYARAPDPLGPPVGRKASEGVGRAGDHHHDHDHDHRHAHDHDDASACGCGGASKLMTPLQAEFLDDGELPEDDLLAVMLGRVDVAQKAGYQPGGPNPLAGPREAPDFDYGLRVLQWDIDPHAPDRLTRQHEIRVGDWDFRVWWQAHEAAGLLYVSMQALREDWIDHEDASPHPIGRSEAVNLVFDERREAVVAIYGTARDFRPFVRAFSVAHERETASETSNREGHKS